MKGSSIGSAAVLLALALVSPSARLHALDWPVAEQKITASFGQDRGDHFLEGIDIDSGAGPVHPAAGGQILFSFDEGSDPRDIPTGLGSFIVIDHSDGYETLYGHLRRGSVPLDGTTVTPADVIGQVGDTGDSLGPHLRFEVINRTNHQFVNPLRLLPPLADTSRPVLQAVLLQRGKRLDPLAPGSSVPAGKAGIIVDAYDPSQFVNYFDPMAPYSIELTLNGKPLYSFAFDALEAEGGQMHVAPARSYTFGNLVLSDGRYQLGNVTLEPGPQTLAVKVSDFSGNAVEQSFEFTVEGSR